MPRAVSVIVHAGLHAELSDRHMRSTMQVFTADHLGKWEKPIWKRRPYLGWTIDGDEKFACRQTVYRSTVEPSTKGVSRFEFSGAFLEEHAVCYCMLGYAQLY